LAAGEITDLSLSNFSYPWQLTTSMASLFLSLAINLSLVSLSSAIFVIAGVVGIGDICYRRYQRYRRSLKIRDKDFSPVSTGDKHSFANISANFEKI
jgi:hypothetical protein